MNPEDLNKEHILSVERQRIEMGMHTSRCYLMRKYQMTDESARVAMKEIIGDDRQSTMEDE